MLGFLIGVILTVALLAGLAAYLVFRYLRVQSDLVVRRADVARQLSNVHAAKVRLGQTKKASRYHTGRARQHEIQFHGRYADRWGQLNPYGRSGPRNRRPNGRNGNPGGRPRSGNRPGGGRPRQYNDARRYRR